MVLKFSRIFSSKNDVNSKSSSFKLSCQVQWVGAKVLSDFQVRLLHLHLSF
jgi:hypothetical protein